MMGRLLTPRQNAPRREGRVEQDQILLEFTFREARVPRIALDQPPASALERIADLLGMSRDVRKVPIWNSRRHLEKGGEGGQIRLIRGRSPRPDLARNRRLIPRKSQSVPAIRPGR